jgi:hypothetical protein
LPQAPTGAPTGAPTWLPPPTEPLPLVVPQGQSPPETTAPPAQLEVAWPPAATELPQMLTGTLTEILTWLPPPTESLPLVQPPEPPPPETLAPPVHAASATPRIAMALPQTSAGTLTGMFTWLPPSSEPEPEVVAGPDTPPGVPLLS